MTTTREMKARVKSSVALLLMVALVLAALFSHHPATAVYTKFQYMEVTPSFPSTLGNCLLVTKTLTDGSVTTCGAACHSTQSCMLFCLKGSKCMLFRAKVTGGWGGAGSGAAYLFSRCWSVYPNSNDQGLGVTTAAKSVYLNFQPSDAVSKLFSCDDLNSCYESRIDTGPWWRADLGSPKTVSEVRIHKHAYLDPAVEFRLGNDTTAANNPLFVTSFTQTIFGELFLKPPTPVIGRYFFVTENLYSDIRVCDVWILGTQESDIWMPNWGS